MSDKLSHARFIKPHEPAELAAFYCGRQVLETPSVEAIEYLRDAVAAGYNQEREYDGVGSPNRCFGNVTAMLERFGGQVVCGWALPKVSGHQVWTEIVDRHCVWVSPEGKLVDVTPGADEWLFIPDPEQFVPNASIRFMSRRCRHYVHQFVSRNDQVRVYDLCPVRPFTPQPVLPLDGDYFIETLNPTELGASVSQRFVVIVGP